MSEETSGSNTVEILEYIVKIVSSNLEELLNINLNIKLSAASPTSLQQLALIAEGTRAKIMELVDKAIEILENSREPLPEPVISDLFTLSGYYYLQGYKTDLEVGSLLRQNININDYFNNIYLLRNKFKKLYDITRASLEG